MSSDPFHPEARVRVPPVRRVLVETSRLPRLALCPGRRCARDVVAVRTDRDERRVECCGNRWEPAVSGDLRHYAVVSAEVMTDPGCSHPDGILAPPEYGCCYAEVLASSKRDAIHQAVKLREFQPWMEEARSDGRNPFAGVTASLTVCEHGVCWACSATADSSGCPTCDAEAEAEFDRELAARSGVSR